MTTLGSLKVLGNWILNGLLVFTVGYVMLRDGGPVRQWWEDRSAAAASSKALAEGWADLAAGGSLIHGDGRATLVEFGDYQCPYCRQAEDSLSSFLAIDSGATVRFRHLPLPQHPQADRAARMAICAEEQGVFRSVHEALYDVQEWSGDWLERVAESANVPDVPALSECLESERTGDRLELDRALAESLGIRGTPAWVGPSGIEPGLIAVSRLRELSAPH